MTEGNGTEDVTVPGIVRGFSDPLSEIKTDTNSDIVQGSEPAAVITARGTAEGLVLRVENGVTHDSARRGLWNFMDSRRNFIAGNELIIEWGTEKPEQSFVTELQAELAKDFEVVFKDAAPISVVPSHTQPDQGPTSGKQRTPSLFDGIEALGVSPGGASSGISSSMGNSSSLNRMSSQRGASKSGAARSSVWDDADARLIYGTLRSGQKVETEHSLIIVGDVNSGAEIVAGGDVMVLGCLRGIAHAGAYDETGGGRMIFALTLQPTQLRIGGVISRGGTSEGYSGPEVARVDGTLIVVEAYQSRAVGTTARR